MVQRILYWDPEMEKILSARDSVSHDEAGLKAAGVIPCEDSETSDQDYWHASGI